MELLDVLKKYSSIIGEEKGKLNARIGELHKNRRKSTEYKFLNLLKYAKIQVTPDIRKIIDEVRHKSVHHGDIGTGNSRLRNHLVLDQLLRDIILNIIGYDKTRISRLSQ